MSDTVAIRAFTVLEQIVRADAPLSLEDATRLVGLPKPTTYRILSSLHGAGLLRRDPSTKRYAVGPRLTALAVELWRQSTLRAQWQSALQSVVDAIDESVNLTILEGREVLYLDRVETRRPLRLHLEPGTRVPLHCTASGKLFLSQMSDAQIRALLGPEPLPRYTPQTIRDYATLLRDIDKVRRTQVGTHDGELFEDSVAIGVPVKDADGRIIAAVAVHAPSSRMSIRDCLQHLPVLQRAAAGVARTMAPGVAMAEPVAARGAANGSARKAERSAARVTDRSAERSDERKVERAVKARRAAVKTAHAPTPRTAAVRRGSPRRSPAGR